MIAHGFGLWFYICFLDFIPNRKIQCLLIGTFFVPIKLNLFENKKILFENNYKLIILFTIILIHHLFESIETDDK